MSWWRAWSVFGAWLVGASLLTGAVRTLQIAYSLRVFGAEALTGGIVGVATLRVYAPMIAAMASCLAVAAGLHRPEPADNTVIPPARGVAPMFAVVLPATFTASGITLLVGAATAALLDIAPSTFWSGMQQFVVAWDLGYGLGKACVYAVLFALIATRIAPVLLASRGRLAGKLAVTCLAAAVSMSIVNGVIYVVQVFVFGRDGGAYGSDRLQLPPGLID